MVQGFFWGDEKVLRLMDLTVAQFCEYSKTTELYTSNRDCAVCGSHLYEAISDFFVKYIVRLSALRTHRTGSGEAALRREQGLKQLL